jgi:hypothetical protein
MYPKVQRLLKGLTPGYESTYILYQITETGYYHSGMCTDPDAPGFALTAVPGYVHTHNQQVAEAQVESLVANRLEDDPTYGPGWEEIHA